MAAALIGAMSFGFAAALQHVATMHVPYRPALRPSLILELVHQPVWTGSLLANILGSALQILALANGPLALVEPMLVTDLLFATVIRSLLVRQRPPLFALVGATLCCAGLALFLVLARPPGGSTVVSVTTVLPYTLGLAALLLICLYVASRHPGTPRALALALACGVLYGVAAGSAKVATGVVLSGGVLALLTSWPLYAMAVLGPTGFILNQNAFQASPVLAPALAVITVTDPLVSIGVGVLWLHETLQAGAVQIVGEIFGLAVMAVGVWLLAHGAQHLINEHKRATKGLGGDRHAASPG
ncbi:MAG: DMT family transporter [Candidatus Dormibacteraceae bacterium]